MTYNIDAAREPMTYNELIAQVDAIQQLDREMVEAQAGDIRGLRAYVLYIKPEGSYWGFFDYDKAFEAYDLIYSYRGIVAWWMGHTYKVQLDNVFDSTKVSSFGRD